jgi:multicomponent K+:H+ antiporter subunit E
LLHFFFFTFLSDIIVANISVVKLILQPDISRLNSGFIQVPLEIKDPMVVTILASIISLTPGTVTAEVSEDQRSLIVHGLDIPDPETEIHLIKTRYEVPLKEIFSC